MRLLISAAVAPWDGPLAERLRVFASAYAVTVDVPRRQQGPPPARLGRTVTAQIRGADAVLALVACGGAPDARQWTTMEVQYARRQKKPVIVLAEVGGQPPVGAGVSVVWFQRGAVALAEPQLAAALQVVVAQSATAAQGSAGGTVAAIAGVALLGLGLLALAVLGDDD